MIFKNFKLIESICEANKYWKCSAQKHFDARKSMKNIFTILTENWSELIHKGKKIKFLFRSARMVLDDRVEDNSK